MRIQLLSKVDSIVWKGGDENTVVFERRNRGTFGDMSMKTVPKKNNLVQKRVSKKRSFGKIKS